MIKLGREEPAISMDVNGGKIILATHSEMQQVNLKALPEGMHWYFTYKNDFLYVCMRKIPVPFFFSKIAVTLISNEVQKCKRLLGHVTFLMVMVLFPHKLFICTLHRVTTPFLLHSHASTSQLEL